MTKELQDIIPLGFSEGSCTTTVAGIDDLGV